MWLESYNCLLVIYDPFIWKFLLNNHGEREWDVVPFHCFQFAGDVAEVFLSEVLRDHVSVFMGITDPLQSFESTFREVVFCRKQQLPVDFFTHWFMRLLQIDKLR